MNDWPEDITLSGQYVSLIPLSMGHLSDLQNAVKDGDLLRADGLGESVELQHLVLDIARRAALRRTLRRARRVPLLQSEHLIFRESQHLISVEGSVFLRALEGGGDAVPAPVWMRLLRNHNRRKWTNR